MDKANAMYHAATICSKTAEQLCQTFYPYSDKYGVDGKELWHEYLNLNEWHLHDNNYLLTRLHPDGWSQVCSEYVSHGETVYITPVPLLSWRASQFNIRDLDWQVKYKGGIFIDRGKGANNTQMFEVIASDYVYRFTEYDIIECENYYITTTIHTDRQPLRMGFPKCHWVQDGNLFYMEKHYLDGQASHVETVYVDKTTQELPHTKTCEAKLPTGAVLKEKCYSHDLLVTPEQAELYSKLYDCDQCQGPTEPSTRGGKVCLACNITTQM